MSTNERLGSAGGVSVEPVDLPETDLEHARGIGATVVILPRSRADDGSGVYGEATLFLAKELRAEGVDVAYLDSPEDRLFEVKKSALAAALITIGLGIVSAAGWDAIKALLRRQQVEDSLMEITYTDLAPDASGRTWTVRGNGKDVINAIDKLRTEPREES